jgi:hypothetical protein
VQQITGFPQYENIFHICINSWLFRDLADFPMRYQSPLFAPTITDLSENLRKQATGCPSRDQHGRAADPEC